MYFAITSSVTLPELQQKYPLAHRCRPQNCLATNIPDRITHSRGHLAIANTASKGWADYYHVFSILPAAILLGLSAETLGPASKPRDFARSFVRFMHSRVLSQPEASQAPIRLPNHR